MLELKKKPFVFSIIVKNTNEVTIVVIFFKKSRKSKFKFDLFCYYI